MIMVGTAGYSYSDWRGCFYPSDIRPGEMLRFYARRFPVVELDFSYYRMPNARTMAGIGARVPPGFRLAVKANRSMTHGGAEGGDGSDEAFAQFRVAVEPLVGTGQLACVLAQFPWSFSPSAMTLAYLRSWPRLLAGLPTVVEFRNSQWVKAEYFEFLRELGLGFCAVDEPQLPGLIPPVVAVTSPLSYLRFHGRNAARWWKHEAAWERYDYLYREDELAEWLPRIREMDDASGQVLVLFNNCHRGQAATNAMMLEKMLREAGFQVAEPHRGGEQIELFDAP
ncbi:MAG: DUF72 domain-containing protein [Bacillota bacterium]